ncbi:MAG: hypothetical protein DMD87_29640 [Candidatus Rokuibacteriota bacterium]|nr:MAG: hypothetical protein DMD87_29640 [Candidatus Rokubacteria bacterium]
MKDPGAKAWLALAASALTTRYRVEHDRALLERRLGGGPTGEKRPAQRLIVSCRTCGSPAG